VVAVEVRYPAERRRRWMSCARRLVASWEVMPQDCWSGLVMASPAGRSIFCRPFAIGCLPLRQSQSLRLSCPLVVAARCRYCTASWGGGHHRYSDCRILRIFLRKC
jgi:hypothetical protein